MGCSFNAFAEQIAVEKILTDSPLHAQGDLNVFAVPFDYTNGMVFTVHVEPGNGTGREGVNLRTVVRKGTRQADATWTWESHLIESRTILDTWHTQASIALDKKGYVHIVYNMHNFPWQYVISDKPFDISSFTFKGQTVTQPEIDRAKFENKTSFPDIGSAAIPGNQVTYPMFFKDKHDDLYITYRFAVKPNRPWEQRAFGAGIARYDTADLTWHAIGGDVSMTTNDAKLPTSKQTAIQKPFAYEDGYTVYLPTLGFDSANNMHVFWNWRRGEAGMETIRPSYAISPDGIHFFDIAGKSLSIPIDFSHSVPVTGINNEDPYYAPKSVALTPQGNPLVVMQPLGVGRQIWSLNKAEKRFIKEESPNAASTIVIDKQGRQWAFATGLRVFMRPDTASRWEDMGNIGQNLCNPKVTYYPAESRFLVHVKSCTNNSASIFSFRR